MCHPYIINELYINFFIIINIYFNKLYYRANDFVQKSQLSQINHKTKMPYMVQMLNSGVVLLQHLQQKLSGLKMGNF